MDFNRFLLDLDTFANADSAYSCWLPLWSGEIFQLVTQTTYMAATGNASTPFFQPFFHLFPIYTKSKNIKKCRNLQKV